MCNRSCIYVAFLWDYRLTQLIMLCGKSYLYGASQMAGGGVGFLLVLGNLLLFALRLIV